MTADGNWNLVVTAWRLLSSAAWRVQPRMRGDDAFGDRGEARPLWLSLIYG